MTQFFFFSPETTVSSPEQTWHACASRQGEVLFFFSMALSDSLGMLGLFLMRCLLAGVQFHLRAITPALIYGKAPPYTPLPAQGTVLFWPLPKARPRGRAGARQRLSQLSEIPAGQRSPTQRELTFLHLDVLNTRLIKRRSDPISQQQDNYSEAARRHT